MVLSTGHEGSRRIGSRKRTHRIPRSRGADVAPEVERRAVRAARVGSALADGRPPEGTFPRPPGGNARHEKGGVDMCFERLSDRDVTTDARATDAVQEEDLERPDLSTAPIEANEETERDEELARI